MEIFSALLAFVRGIHRSPVNSPHKSQWCGALMFSLICARINGWVNNGEAGDLRHHCVHYNVIVMEDCISKLLTGVHLLTLVFQNPFVAFLNIKIRFDMSICFFKLWNDFVHYIFQWYPYIEWPWTHRDAVTILAKAMLRSIQNSWTASTVHAITSRVPIRKS